MRHDPRQDTETWTRPGYGQPAQGPAPKRNGLRGALFAAGAGLAAVAVVGGLWLHGTAGQQHTAAQPHAVASSPAHHHRHHHHRHAAAAAPAQAAPAQAAPAPAPAALTARGTGTYGEEIYANAATSTAFAMQVEADYWPAGGSPYYSYSAVTGQEYYMTPQTAGASGGSSAVTTVTGGNGVVVQFGA